MNLQTINASASPEVQINENFEVLDWATVYAKNPVTSSGLTWGFFGGRWGGFLIPAGTLALTNTATNHVVVERATGAISVSTIATNWDNTSAYARVYKLTTAGGVVTAVEDHRAGSGGVISGATGAAGVAMALGFTSDTGSVVDSDPGAGLFKWNNAIQASATFLYFDDQTRDLVSVTTFWNSLQPTGYIYMIQADDPTKWQLWKWTSLPVDGTGYRKFPVALQANGGSIAHGKVVHALFFGTGPATFGRHSVPVMAAAIFPSVTGGCAALSRLASVADQPDIVTLDFDPTTQEHAQFAIPMPKSWNEGTLTFKPVWSHPATTVNFGVAWSLQAVAASNDDPIAVAYGTAQTSVDTGGTTNDLYVGPESSAITVAGTPAAEDIVYFRVSRVTADAGDNMAVDARLHGIILYITTDADNDA